MAEALEVATFEAPLTSGGDPDELSAKVMQITNESTYPVVFFLLWTSWYPRQVETRIFPEYFSEDSITLPVYGNLHVRLSKTINGLRL